MRTNTTDRAGAAIQAESSQHVEAAWPQQAIPASTRSMNLPRSLTDLPAWRQPLLNATEGSLSRQYGERLRDLQESRASFRIDQLMFEKRANQIAEDLKDHENELPYWDHHLANADVGLQYLRFSGPRLTETAMQHAEAAIRNLGQTVQEVTDGYGVTHHDNLARLEEVATRTANSGGPRLTETAMQYAQAAIRHLGQTVQEVTEWYEVTHPDDLILLEEVATRTADSGGPRLTETAMQHAEAAIRQLGRTVQEVAEWYRVTHAEDLTRLEEVARS